MAKPKMHAAPSQNATPAGARDVAKQELARQLAALLQKNDWNQSDLARKADIPRELVSTYVRGKAFPTPKSLRRIADAFGLTVEELVPATHGMIAQDEIPSFAVTEIAGHPGRVWLRVNRYVGMATAMKIAALLEGDNAHA